MLSRPVELYNLFKIIRPDIIPSFTEYVYRYCAPKQTKYGMDYSGNSCTTELHYILSKSLMIRRLKKDVLHELPSKRRQKIEVHMDKKHVQKIRGIIDNILEDDPMQFLNKLVK